MNLFNILETRAESNRLVYAEDRVMDEYNCKGEISEKNGKFELAFKENKRNRKKQPKVSILVEKNR